MMTPPPVVVLAKRDSGPEYGPTVPVLGRRPSAALAPFVRWISYSAGEQRESSRERILPDATASLWVNLNEDEFRTYGGVDQQTVTRVPGAALDGPHDRATVLDIEAGRSHVWASFAPGVAPPFFDASPSAAVNLLVPVEDLWGRDGAVLRERLLDAATPEGKLRVLEAVLLDHATPGEPDPAITFAVAALDRGARVADVAAELGMLGKTFGRRFRRQVGLPPKRFARVRRLRRVVGAVEGLTEVNWSVAAAEHGYCDSAHLVDDFRDLVGTTPTGYLLHRAGGPGHVLLPAPPEPTGTG